MPINARAAYRETSVSTAPPGRLLTMLYDRLARDLHEAGAAIDRGAFGSAHMALVHGQDIVTALNAALDLAVWPGGRGLADLYEFLLHELATANLTKNSESVRSCLVIIEPLVEAWHEAYRRAGSLTLLSASAGG